MSDTLFADDRKQLVTGKFRVAIREILCNSYVCKMTQIQRMHNGKAASGAGAEKSRFRGR